MENDRTEQSKDRQLSCNDAVQELFFFLDGELTDDKRTVIAKHLDHCAPCGSAAHFEAELRQVIVDRCAERVPPALIEQVAKSIEEEAQRDS
jgi:mycothiol system anti-sigma-R factor